ncbi:MAG: hypothetical protein JWP82_3321, partial [Humibacillus sp.]|nr:hypothetical protein [Humibacillus sp.]
MTDETRPDPLAADFDPGSIPAAPAPTGGGVVPEVQGVPDPSTDQWSAFDEPTPPRAATPPAAPAPTPSVPRQNEESGRKSRKGRSGAANRPAPVATAAPTRKPPPLAAPTARKKATRTVMSV